MSSQISQAPLTTTVATVPAIPATVTRPTLKKPLILDYYVFTEEHEPYLKNTLNKLQLTCKICNREIAASIKITSNWITHLKVAHLNDYQEYSKKKAPKVKYNKMLTLMQQQTAYNTNLNYDTQRFTNNLNGTNSVQDHAAYYDMNDDENEDDILDYEENDSEYFKVEQGNWNSTSTNPNKSVENTSLDENENWFADEQNNSLQQISTSDGTQSFNLRNNIIKKRPLAAITSGTTSSPQDSKRTYNAMLPNNCSSSSLFNNKQDSNSAHAIITTTTNNTPSTSSSSNTFSSSVSVRNVIASMVDLIRGSAEAEKKILCLECHTKVKWVDYFTHVCDSDK